MRTITIRHDERTGEMIAWLDRGEADELITIDQVIIEVGGTTITWKADNK